MERRAFIGKSAAASVLLGMNMMAACGAAKTKLKVLVLGGTYFVGPAIVNAALQNNHDVTLFNRGITNPQLFAALRLIKGDRETGIKAYNPLLKEKWDVVIDVWPEKSILVKEATTALAKHCKHYVFISSIAVYNDFQEVGLHEESEVVNLDISASDWTYSEEKLAAENAVREKFPGHHTIIRPGAIKGWRDPAMDLLFWCIKLNRDDSIIAPGSGLDPLQFVDVHDVGRFALMAAQQNISGTYNCIGPGKETLIWKDFLDIARDHFKSSTELIWASEAFLKEHQVYSFSDLPLWAPLSEDEGFMQISNKKLIQTGFEFSSIPSTLDTCMQWYKENMAQNLKFGTSGVGVGLERTRELELIDTLKG